MRVRIEEFVMRNTSTIARYPLIPRSASRTPHSSRAAALVAVTWIVLLAGLVLLGVNGAAGVNFAMAHSELARVQARWLARAGVEQAVAILDDDSKSVDSTLDWWYEDSASFEEIELVTGQFSVVAPAEERTPRVPRYGLLDLNARIDPATATDRQLAAIQGLDPSIIDAILDWCDEDDNPRPGGAERGYYQRLDHPYEIRNQPFETRDEMLLVRGIDRKVLYGDDTNGNGVTDPGEPEGDPALRGGLSSWTAIGGYELNQDSAGVSRTNINKVDPGTLKEAFKFTDALANALVQYRAQRGGQFQNLADLFQVRPQQFGNRGLPTAPGDEQVTQITPEWLAKNIDRLTTKDEPRLPARINLNTAPRHVLLTLPGMTPDAADAIVAFRDSSKGPFRSVGDLITTNTVDQKIFSTIAELTTVRSNVFRIVSIGTAASGIRCTATVIIDRNAKPPILYWHESE